jgi:hypothetical protein
LYVNYILSPVSVRIISTFSGLINRLMKSLKIGNLAIAVPVIQGGMGVGVSLSGLAAAVSN